MDKLAETAFADCDLTPTQGFTLLLIGDRNMTSPGTIADEMGMKPSTITRFIDTLAQKGYVERSYSGRTAILSLTAEGESKLEKINKNWNKIYELYIPLLGEEFAKKLTADLSQASRMIDKGDE